MNRPDRELGMHREISRRDFISGVAGAAAGAALVGTGCGPKVLRSEPTPPGPVGYYRANAPDAAGYPPIRTDLRGSHEGSYNTMHALAREGKTDWGTAAEPDETLYDLVVVGGGVSGLAAAYFYRKDHPDARILVLENHDDFGGHAKRNEWQVGDRTIVGYGGSQTMEDPDAYSDAMTGLLEELAVDASQFNTEYYDHDFYRRHGLTEAIYFDKNTFGVDKTVPFPSLDASYFMPTAESGMSLEDAVAQMPLSDEAKRQMIRLNTLREDTLPDHGMFAESDYLYTITYLDFLTKHANITNEEVIKVYQDVTSPLWAVGIDAVPAIEAMLFGLPGLNLTGLGRFEGLMRRGIGMLIKPYTAHFPDGNGSLPRLLVRKLIPGIAEGTNAEDVVTAHFDYGKLDAADSPTRIRLSSTCINVDHVGDVGSAKEVTATYVRHGVTERVKGKRCILACYGVVVPHICPGMPERQREALSTQVKAPYVITNVLLRNWQALKKQRIAIATCPGRLHKTVQTDFPVSMGDYKFANDPEHPIVLAMHHIPTFPGAPPREQFRAGRFEMLSTSFEDFEREIRDHMAGMLGPGGLDPAEDILGITVNRHAHGYAYEYSPLWDPEYAEGEAPHEVGRQPFGRIHVANSDAGASAYLDSAVDQAWRAVQEIST